MCLQKAANCGSRGFTIRHVERAFCFQPGGSGDESMVGTAMSQKLAQGDALLSKIEVLRLATIANRCM